MKRERIIDEFLETGIRDKVFLSAACSIVKKNSVYWGAVNNYYNLKTVDENTFFDLASLTKPLVTSTLLVNGESKNLLSMNDPLEKFIEEAKTSVWGKVKLKQFLNHISGMRAYKYLFLNYITKGGYFESDSAYKTELLKDILSLEPVNKGETAVYSDFGFFVLGVVSEKIFGEELTDIRKKLLGKYEIIFNPSPDLAETIPPTESVSYRRGNIVQGAVHDEHAFLVGGMAGHAGAFATIRGLSLFVKDILNGEFSPTDEPDYYRKLPQIRGTFVDGWDKPSPKGSQAGKYFKTAIGHLGYTGTSIWIDFERETGIILLTNRTFPSRFNKRILKFRPWIHDRLIESYF